MSVQVVCYQLYLDKHLNKPFIKSDIWDVPKAKSLHVQRSINHFIEVAERRESILRLARLISYNPKRNQAANGLLKIESISTTEDVVDSNGNNLSNQSIIWNDGTNPNWYEQFIKVLNASLPVSTSFGRPIKKANINGVATEQYRFNGINTDIPSFTFDTLL